MVKISVIGAKGRMGAKIIDAITYDSQTELVGAVETADSPFIGQEIVLGSGVKITGGLSGTADKTDIYIDFSFHESTINNIKSIVKQGKGLIIGTTGFSDAEKNMIEEASKKIPIVFAPNMSIGVNVFFNIIKKAAAYLKDYDTEIIELHHNQKKDSPSGTALMAAKCIAESTGKDKKNWIYGRKGMTNERPDKEICIHAVRAGDIIGEHTALFAGNNERVEITHRAHTRDNFASGAVLAAKWLKGKPAGLYDMNDVLGLD
ncbi:MAG: 4-hydroxy-tetrahydrodipicolinate reductase [Elusimicrobiota bacterium]